jgi:hypothetical protein
MSAASLPILLRAMRLPTIAREQEKAIARAEAENWGYQRFLEYLFEAEGNDCPAPIRFRGQRQLESVLSLMKECRRA